MNIELDYETKQLLRDINYAFSNLSSIALSVNNLTEAVESLRKDMNKIERVSNMLKGKDFEQN